MADTELYIDSVNVGGTHYDIADPQARAVATEKYDENVDYAVGDFCIKDDILYKFTKAKTKEPWDAGVVEQTTVPAELKATQKKITDLTEKMYTPDVIGIQVNADNNSVTFKLKKPSVAIQRYTAILAQTHQDGGLIGIYVISVNSSKDVIAKIAGYDATISRSGDNVTVTFDQIVSIWSSGILIAPKGCIC